MKTKPFSELQKRMTPEQRAKSDARAKVVSLHIALIELKQSLGIAQEDLEKELGFDLSEVSDLESLDNLQIKTLYRYINALGGSLKIVAHFPNEEVVLAQFE
ncbi:transcriptional regulator [Calothrix sp. HK-06]|nr:transcriptional regulator [Calothrix sp. HK-06]